MFEVIVLSNHQVMGKGILGVTSNAQSSGDTTTTAISEVLQNHYNYLITMLGQMAFLVLLVQNYTKQIFCMIGSIYYLAFIDLSFEFLDQ